MIGFKSITNWSSSFFGGSLKLIQDHPYVSVPPTIEFEPSEELKKECGHYYSNSLLRMYLYQVLQSEDKWKYEEIVKNTFDNPSPEDIITKKVYDLREGKFIENQYVKIPLYKVLPIINLDDKFEEYLELYQEDYKEELQTSYILHMIPPPEEEGEGKGDGGSSEEENEEKSSGKSGEGEQEEAQTFEESLEEALNKVRIFSRESNNVSEFSEKPVFKKLPKTFTEETPLSSISNKYGPYLEKLLDIDFDPKSDVIKSLKTGKLDLSKICEVPAGNLNVYQRVEEDVDTQTFSVVILADMSGSMRDNSRNVKQKYVLDTLYTALKDKLKDRLFIFGHTGEYTPEIYTFLKPGEDNYMKDHRNYTNIEFQQNYDGPVLEAVYDKVRSITEEKILLITLSDGFPCGNNYGGVHHNEELKRIIEKLNRDNFITTCLGLDAPGVEELYKYGISINFSKSTNEYMKDIAVFINKVVRLELK